MINARAETVAVKPAFRSAFKKGRCLIVADGFYEWKKTGSTKQPFFIRLKDDEPFAFAGLSEHWHRGDQIIDSATIITTDANELIEGIYDRMPVILSPDNYDLWLEPEFHGEGKLPEMLKPYPAEEMMAYPVSTLVNNPRNEGGEVRRGDEVKWLGFTVVRSLGNPNAATGLAINSNKFNRIRRLSGLVGFRWPEFESPPILCLNGQFLTVR